MDGFVVKIIGGVVSGLVLMFMSFFIGRASVSEDLSVINQRLVALEVTTLHIITQQTNMDLKIDRLLERE